MIGLGARVRIRPTVYLVLEGAPRTGYDPGRPGQLRHREARRRPRFQLNFSNGFGTTFAQIARGGTHRRRLVSRLQYLAEVFQITGKTRGGLMNQYKRF